MIPFSESIVKRILDLLTVVPLPLLLAHKRNGRKKMRAPIPFSRPPPAVHSYPLDALNAPSNIVHVIANGDQWDEECNILFWLGIGMMAWISHKIHLASWYSLLYNTCINRCLYRKTFLFHAFFPPHSRFRKDDYWAYCHTLRQYRRCYEIISLQTAAIFIYCPSTSWLPLLLFSFCSEQQSALL